MEATHPGRRLRAARRQRDWTQQELANKTNLSQPVISALERGHLRYPGYIRRVAECLGVDDAELI